MGKAYYLVFVPTVFENGFTMTFSKGSSFAVYDRTKKTNIRRCAFGGLTNPDANLEWETPYVNIPDPNFKSYCVQNFDNDGDGEISYEEALTITTINVNTDDICTLKGVEHFTNLSILNCSGSNVVENNEIVRKGQLASLDVHCNTALQNLSCDNNQLTSLNISNNTALTTLNCSSNQLTSLDVSQNSFLSILDCSYNQLTSIQGSGNRDFYSLDCRYNQITSLTAVGHSGVRCDYNQLTFLQVVVLGGSYFYVTCTNNPNLTIIYLQRQQQGQTDVIYDTGVATIVYN